MDCSVANTLPMPKSISVNGAVITREVIAREVQNHPAEKPILAWQAGLAWAFIIGIGGGVDGARVAMGCAPIVG